FLKAIKGRFGLAFTYNANSRVCYITQFTAAIAAGPAIDLTPFQAGDYSTAYPNATGYTVNQYLDSSDELNKDSTGNPIDPESEVVGGGQTLISLQVGSMQLAYQPSGLSDGAFWLIPTVRQPGNTLDANYKLSSRYLSKEGKRPNNVGLCLIAYRGMTQDSAGNAYPLATPDVRNGQQL
ncbi:hypothetical protein, partial [Spirosoma harenae]